MKDIKKLMITLVALLAVTTQAWADGVKLTTVEIVPTAAWNGNYDELPPSDMPGLTADGITEDQAKAWADVPKSGYVDLIYGYVVYETYTDYKVVQFLDGEFSNSLTKIETYHGVYLDKDIGTTIYYVASAASGTAVTVDWNKTTKTGSFTMPGGNVELEPEYYPQAVLTAQPTAIDNVPATTDGAIVNAGTVANITGTTTAQGTVMYYVSTTALDDDALLALAADQWTADVPTAESFTAAGQAYVYYYVRGNDSDTDDEIFSDGDILSANKLTVTIAAAPTYAVTFADDTAEPDKWTASPNANVTKGETVTVTYTGSKKVLGVKAEKKAAPVYPMVSEATAADYGKVVCAAGHLHDAKTAVPSGCTAVGILGKVTETGHGLILALQDATSQNWNTINGWASVTTYAGTTLKQLPAGALGSLTSYTTLGETAVSNWAVAQKSDYDAIFQNLGSTQHDQDGYTYDGNVNDYITTGVGGTAISDKYWSATRQDGNWAYDFESEYWNVASVTGSLKVRPVLGF